VVETVTAKIRHDQDLRPAGNWGMNTLNPGRLRVDCIVKRQCLRFGAAALRSIPSTIEAAALCKMADRGQITGAILDGARCGRLSLTKTVYDYGGQRDGHSQRPLVCVRDRRSKSMELSPFRLRQAEQIWCGN
jgi:hypothetical protein